VRLDVTGDTFQRSLLEYEPESGIILARCCGLVGSFAAHGALVALWAVRALVWSVFGAGRLPLDALHRLSKFQRVDFASDIVR
jgi:hypothetical protein